MLVDGHYVDAGGEQPWVDMLHTAPVIQPTGPTSGWVYRGVTEVTVQAGLASVSGWVDWGGLIKEHMLFWFGADLVWIPAHSQVVTTGKKIIEPITGKKIMQAIK